MAEEFGEPLAEDQPFTDTKLPLTKAPNPADPSMSDHTDPSVADYAVDGLRGIARGAENAVRGARNTVRAIGVPIAEAMGLEDQARLMKADLEYGSEAPRNVAGEITSGLTEAGLSWVAGGAVLKGAGLAVKGTTVLGAAVQTGVGSALTSDPNHQRISNVLAKFPVIGPAFDLLAQNPNDNQVVARVKSVLEESFTAGAAQGIFNSLALVVRKFKGAAASDSIVKDLEKKVLADDAALAAVGAVDNAAAKPVAAAAPVAPVAPVVAAVAPKPTYTVLKVDGEPLVKVGDKEAEKFIKMQDKLVHRVIAGEMIPPPKQGLTESAAKDGVGIRQPLTEGTPNEVLQGLADLGTSTKKQLNSTVETEAATRAGAAILGLDPALAIAKLQQMRVSLEDGGSVLVGVKELMQHHGLKMFALAKKAALGDLEAREAHKQIFVGLSGVQAELAKTETLLGRSMHSLGYKTSIFDKEAILKRLADPKEAKKIEQLMIAADGDPVKVAAIIQLQNLSWGSKAVGVHNEYWTGLALLGRATTQGINAIATGLNTAFTPATLIAGGLAQGVAGKGFQSARMGLGIYAHMHTAFRDSMKMSWAAFKSGEAIISRAETSEVKLPFISSMAFNMNPDNYAAKMIDYFGEGVRLSFRGLTAGDEFWKQLNYRAYIASKAAMDAADQVAAGTMKHDGISAHIDNALHAAFDDQRRGIIPDALKYAEKTSFVNDLKIDTHLGAASLGEMAARFSSHPVIRGMILPFVKTPTNVTRTTFEFTPIIGQMRKQFWTDTRGGGFKAAEAIGKLTIGSSMYLGAGFLVMEGRVTGATPPKGVYRPPGWQPYSIKFNGMGPDGEDLYLSYQRLQPFGDILGMTADFAASSGMLDPDTRDGLANSMSLALTKFFDAPASQQAEMVGNGAIGASAAFAKSVVSKTYFRNMTEFFSTFSGYDNETKVARWWQNYAASHVPGMLSSLNDDPAMREVRSTLDAVIARIPGVSQVLPPRRDYVGRINDTRIGMPYSTIVPFSARLAPQDNVFSELQRLSDSTAEADFNEPASKYTVGGKPVDLKEVYQEGEKASAYDRMQDLIGTIIPRGEHLTFHEKLREVIGGSRYELGNEAANARLDATPDIPGYRIKAIKAEEMKYRTAALEQTKDEYANVLGIKSAQDDALKTKMARTRASRGLVQTLLDLNK